MHQCRSLISAIYSSLGPNQFCSSFSQALTQIFVHSFVTSRACSPCCFLQAVCRIHWLSISFVYAHEAAVPQTLTGHRFILACGTPCQQ
jgi:hypothetical protein